VADDEGAQFCNKPARYQMHAHIFCAWALTGVAPPPQSLTCINFGLPLLLVFVDNV
jgi:hypothetical protein